MTPLNKHRKVRGEKGPLLLGQSADRELRDAIVAATTLEELKDALLGPTDRSGARVSAQRLRR